MDSETAEKGLKHGAKIAVSLAILAAFLALIAGLAIGFGLGSNHYPDVCEQWNNDCDGPVGNDEIIIVPDYSGSMDLELDRIKRAVEDYARMRMEKALPPPDPTPIAPPLPENRNRIWEI